MTLLASILSPAELIRSLGLVGIIAIVFAESGLLIGFFLPGDSLLFIAGYIASGPAKYPDLHLPLIPLLIGAFAAAVIGDQVGFTIGAKAGPRIFDRPDSRLFKRAHVERAHAFFEKHGPKTIVLARFVPVVRTFVPVVAGVGDMDRKTFTIYNVIGGAAWAVGITLLGYFGGQIRLLNEHIELAVLGVVAISLLPIAFELIRARGARPHAD